MGAYPHVSVFNELSTSPPLSPPLKNPDDYFDANTAGQYLSDLHIMFFSEG